jgi:hypothetical protein
VKPDIESGGENIFGCGFELEQPAKTISEIERAARQRTDSESNEGPLAEGGETKFPNILAICLRLVKFFLQQVVLAILMGRVKFFRTQICAPLQQERHGIIEQKFAGHSVFSWFSRRVHQRYAQALIKRRWRR